VIKIWNDKFELYSIYINGEKHTGTYETRGDILSLYQKSNIINCDKDTLVSLDTLKFVYKGRKLIPFKNEIYSLKRTRNKRKYLKCFVLK